MTIYPNEAYQPVIDFYGKLPQGKKDAANKILDDFKKRYKEGEAPPEEMLSSLKALVSKKEGGLESKIKAQPSSVFERIGSFFSKPAVAASATALLLLYLGLPPLY
ncbi:hypothetical protein HYX00_03375 [Candidatus Woesearchaeota archaeon]|nr:hypothetical protein [Candidatus Woesearchaeota archaeon]